MEFQHSRAVGACQLYSWVFASANEIADEKKPVFQRQAVLSRGRQPHR